MELPLFENLKGNELKIIADRMNFFEVKTGIKYLLNVREELVKE
jgi:hypothetical protein